MGEVEVYRILVASSREWEHPETIYRRLDEVYDDLNEEAGGGLVAEPILIIVGDARGGDTFVRQWAEKAVRDGRNVCEPEVHEANWFAPCIARCRPGHRRPSNRRGPDGELTICPTAGIYRNERMVNRGADMCLAFIHGNSNEATHCKKLAKAAGMYVEVVRE